MESLQGVDVARWDTAFSRPKSVTFESIARRWLTNAYPSDVQPLTIWPTWDLEVVASRLGLQPGQTLVDLGCGGAAPGLWIARRLRARYVGVDPSEVALEQARARAPQFLDPADVRFVRGHFHETDLDDAAADGVVAMDSFHFATDFARALVEIARVMRSGARLAMAFGYSPNDQRLAAAGFEELARAAGLGSVVIDETPDFPTRFRAAWSDVLENIDAITAEVGAEYGAELSANATALLAGADHVRHVLLAAERTRRSAS